MDSATKIKPVLIAGGGPVGLMTALALSFYRIPCILLEEDERLSLDTKAGTILTRTIEAFRRYGVDGPVLSKALRVDVIGEIERSTNLSRGSVDLSVLHEDTRFPYVLNIPQGDLEAILAGELEEFGQADIRMGVRLCGFEQSSAGVTAELRSRNGTEFLEGSYLLACDGGQSTVRTLLGVEVEGETLDVRYMLVDLKVDLDVGNPRDYPYLAYFSDPEEWVILIRQPHCWRFLFPLEPGKEEPDTEALCAKALRFVGDVDQIEVLQTVIYRVHHRVAERWSDERVFLMGDAAHLITPMWALGLNTGVLDTISLPWRLAWVLRGWAPESLLEGYECEQKPVAALGSGEMAEAARKLMADNRTATRAMSGAQWGNACTRGLLGVKLDVEGTGDWSMVRTDERPMPIRPGERMPDFTVHLPDGTICRLHDLIDDNFLALYFVDARRRPELPFVDSPALRHFLVSRWDAPLDSGLRESCLLDVGDRLRERLGVSSGTMVLIRPDDHIAAILPMAAGDASAAYRSVIGRDPPPPVPKAERGFI